MKDNEVDENTFSKLSSPSKTYIGSGALGDFIQSLSVICENYYNTGSKGILYIHEKEGENFRNGLLNTYNDIYPIIIKQKYIENFEIYNNQHIDIDLSKWRTSPILWTDNWYNIFNTTYNVDWGKKKWLECNTDYTWTNINVINSTDYRFFTGIDFFNNLNNDESYVFISSDIKHYDFFLKQINNNIKVNYHQFNSFEELVTIINSCKLFIGGFSAPLSIANALHKDRIVCKSSHPTEIRHNDLMNYLPNIRMIV